MMYLDIKNLAPEPAVTCELAFFFDERSRALAFFCLSGLCVCSRWGFESERWG